jgi:glycosyltransferase involved in cell wall biosynthesis
MAKGDKVIAVSNFIRQHIFDNYKISDPKKVVVIHRGVNLEEFNPNNIISEDIKKFKEEKFLPLNVPVILLPRQNYQMERTGYSHKSSCRAG